MSRRVWPLMAAVFAMAAAGCDSAVSGTPVAGDTPPDTVGAPTAEPDDLAPPVENPKDLRGVDPCGLLGPENLAEMRSGPGQAGTSDWGEAECDWVGSVVAMGLSPDTTVGGGLNRAYRNRHLFDNFAPSEVDGYPAARINVATQSCGLIVGVGPDQALLMEYTRVSPDAPGLGDPCGFAESVMGDALKRVPDA